MDYNHYLDIFQQSADRLDKRELKKKGIEVAVGIVLNSVFLKLYKKSWTNPLTDPLTAPTRIFLSVWINESSFKKEALFYNIHALKLRHLKGYAIQSRKFAESFREKFREYEDLWQNVNVTLGPLTLMEGWQKTDTGNPQGNILELATNFLKIEHLIDDTLQEFKL